MWRVHVNKSELYSVTKYGTNNVETLHFVNGIWDLFK